jgi:two-component system LytT family sensor kinase
MITSTSAQMDSRLGLRRAGTWVVGLFWLLQFVELTVVSVVEGSDVALKSFVPRLLVLGVGIVLTLGFREVVAKLDGQSFRRRLILTIGSALICCAIVATVNFFAFYYAFTKGDVPFDLTEYIYVAFTWSWFFLSVAGALLALSYNMQAADRERRLVAMEAVANRAQLAALRYQLNPHFLFNTLNSIAALVARGDNHVAEAMVENLADFLRATLELDPLEDIRLAQEVELQRMYLSIEEQRFPDRLMTHFKIPADVADALVPALITQPLVENAIRHAVARSVAPVTICFTAAAAGDVLTLSIEDDGSSRREGVRGTGVGISNVKARLAARFGVDHLLSAGVREGGGFRVELRMPLRRS